MYGETPTNRFVGYLPDVPEFYSFMTAREYLRLCGESLGLEDAEIKKRSDELLSMEGLFNEKSRVKGYSRGMKQRLGIAQALFSRPKLLICDEPTSALDPIGRKEILDLLLSVREQTTVLFSTHILSDVERIATDIALLDGGKIQLSGVLSDIKATYRRDGYRLTLENEADAAVILATFPTAKQEGSVITFDAKETDPSAVFGLLSDRRIGVLGLVRIEPTLEALFREVIAK